MQIIARSTLKAFWEKHPRARQPLETWFLAVRKTEWSGPADVKAMFGANVDFIADNRIVFDISGNTYRLIVRVSYTFKVVQIKFVGTHAEYDRIDAETV